VSLLESIAPKNCIKFNRDMEKKKWLETAEAVLPLASHVAQVLTVALTAGGLFFTVIPLYQKAAVDEQVAKQQFKLEQLEQRVEASYQKIRSDMVRRYVFNAGIQCTGLMTPPSPIGANGAAPDFTEQALAVDVPQCMRDELAKVAELHDMRPEDRTTFAAAVTRTSSAVDVARLAAQAQVARVDIAHDPVGPVDIGSYAMMQLSILKRAGLSDQEIRQLIRTLNASAKRLRLEDKYAAYARSEIGKLNDIRWSRVSSVD
jgi:hypothetical protein